MKRISFTCIKPTSNSYQRRHDLVASPAWVFVWCTQEAAPVGHDGVPVSPKCRLQQVRGHGDLSGQRMNFPHGKWCEDWYIEGKTNMEINTLKTINSFLAITEGSYTLLNKWQNHISGYDRKNGATSTASLASRYNQWPSHNKNTAAGKFIWTNHKSIKLALQNSV